MYGDLKTQLQAELDEIRAAGLYKGERVIDTPQAARVSVGERSVLNMCANNYLGLASHPEVIATARAALDEWGYGLASVRFICGTQAIHKKLEDKLSEFLGMEDTILYTSCFDANGGLFETLLGPEDAVISDELNHASIIDGVRLCKAKRFRYKNNDMADLAAQLEAAKGARRILIVTDGVFSMDGDYAPLDEVNKLAEEYGAMVLVDDCHGEGVLGEGGRGIVDHFKLQGKVDFEVGSFSKALGVQGGILAGTEMTRTHALNHSRSWLLSGSQPPGVAAAQKAAIEVLMEEPEHHAKLWENTNYFRKELQSLGFDTGVSTTPIIPIMCGESSTAKAMTTHLQQEGVMAGAIVFPMVARDKARIRTQMSAGLSRDDLDDVLRLLESIGPKVGLI